MAKQQIAANKMFFDLPEVAEMIAHSFNEESTKRDVLHLVGPPGVGKSSIVEQAAEKLKYVGVITFMASQRAKEDLVGPPYLIQPEDPHNDLRGREALGYTKFYPPKTMLVLTKEYEEEQRLRHNGARQRLVDAGRTDEAEAMGEFKPAGPMVLFLDELANAAPDVQTVYHTLILNGKFGDEEYTLRDNVRVIAASNRQEDGANVHKMSAPLQNRLKEINVRPTVTGWLDWAREADVYEPIRAYVRQHETMLGLDGIDPKQKNQAQPTPRAWEKVSNSCHMKAYQINPGDSNETRSRKLRQLQGFIEGSIGAGAASEFMKFMEYAREAPSAEDIAANPEKVDTFHDKSDLALVAVENMISGARRNPKFVRPFMKYAKRMKQQYLHMLNQTLFNIDGNMPIEVITEMLDDENFATGGFETASRLQQISQDDKGESRVRRTTRK